MKQPDTVSIEPFLQYLAEKFPEEGKRSTGGVIHQSFSKRIKDCLKDPSTADKSFWFYVKKECFELFDLPSLDLSDVLVIPSLDTAQVRFQLVNY